jgi:hypothetical protein
MPKKSRKSAEGFFSCVDHPMLIVPTMDNHQTGLHGGKFNFGKAIKSGFKHVGHVLAPIAKSVGNEAKNIGMNVLNKTADAAKQEFANNLINSGNKLLPSLEAAAPEIAEGAMLAAGKPKRKRAVSAKMAKRGALIKKIMKEHNCNLPTASRYIKQHSLI